MTIETKGGQYLRIEAEIQIDAAPAKVFEALTTDIDTWWPHRTDERAKIVFEAEPGGRIYEDHGKAGHTMYGTVAAYQPPGKLVTVAQSGWGDAAYNTRNTEILESDGKGGTIYKKTLVLWGVIPEDIAGMFEGGVPSLQVALKEHLEK